MPIQIVSTVEKLGASLECAVVDFFIRRVRGWRHLTREGLKRIKWMEGQVKTREREKARVRNILKKKKKKKVKNKKKIILKKKI